MKKLFTVLVLILAACSNGDDGAAGTAVDSPVALLTADGNVALYDPAGDAITAVTSDAGAGRTYGQPTWSPDGSRLAFVASATTVAPGVEAGGPTVRVGLEAQQGVDSAIHIVSRRGDEETIIPTSFLAFYLYWSPDGRSLAFLGNDPSIPGQGLGMIDVESSRAERIDTGRPYYFAWSPASDRLLVHAENTELYYLGLDGARTEVGAVPGAFSAPHWLGETQLYPVRDGEVQALSLFDVDGRERRRVAESSAILALGLSPDEQRLAFIDIVPEANPFALGALVVETPTGSVQVAEQAAAFFWSPSGERLLYLTPDLSGGAFTLQWNVWDGDGSVAFAPFLPTRTFVHQYLPFFGQYANSLTFFSPDGESFTFAGSIAGAGEGIWVQEISATAPARLIADGEFSTWAPGRS